MFVIYIFAGVRCPMNPSKALVEDMDLLILGEEMGQYQVS